MPDENDQTSRAASRPLLDQLVDLFPDLRRIDRNGFVVGGAIRDLLRGEQPADVDVACHDPLACAEAFGRKVIRLGRDHLNAWRVFVPPRAYDFAEILDGDISRDLARRDFTVNAMAVSLDDGRLLDPNGGRSDLGARVVRMIDPSNFDDDPLRLLKSVRMAVRLGFSIDEETLAAVRQRAASIGSVAPERVGYELSLILSSGAFRRAIDLLHATALDAALFGRDLDPSRFHSDDVPPAAAYALITSEARTTAQRWRWSRDHLREVLAIQALLVAAQSTSDQRVALYDAGEKTARDFLAALRATGSRQQPELPRFDLRPLLSGEEIASITGVEPGPELGALQRKMLEKQIRGELKTRAEAERFVSERH